MSRRSSAGAGRARAVFGALLVAALLAALPVSAQEVPVDPSWAGGPVWDDGLAEVSVYDAERVVYGRPRAHTLVMILVKEELSGAAHVKADPPYAGRPLTTALKLNLVSTLQTENYPYHYLASIFVRRDDVRRLVKATVGSQEWCGNTFKEVITWDGPPRIHFHSYFDGQGDGEQPLPLGADGLLDEQILIVIRSAVLPEGGQVTLHVADPIVTNQAKPVVVREARLSAGGSEDVDTPMGRIRARRYDLIRSQDETAAYWVEEAAPRALVRMAASDGRRLALRERSRRNYWSG